MTGGEGVLGGILEQTRATLARRKAAVPLERLRDELHAARERGRDSAVAEASPTAGGARFGAALARPGIGAIAEFKRRSPSAGELRAGAEVAALAGAYERGGAVAMSVLTEQYSFAGSLADLRAARAACSLPLLRKDFVVDAYQLYEAALAGADAVLLIVAALEEQALGALYEQALALGLDVLVEVHDAAELERAAALRPRIVGVNNRDLRDFSVQVERTFRLLDRMPSGALVVSESGIASREQVVELERAGVAAVLVGERLMRAPDPGAALAELIGCDL